MVNINNSERLSYQLATRKDIQCLFELDQDPLVMKYINGGICTSMDTIKNVFMPRVESYTNQEKGWGLWKISIESTNTFIGFVLVRPMDFFTNNPQFNDLEIGWRFMQKYWGKGFASEAAKHIMHSIAKQSQVNQFSAIALKDNIGSINIMKKLGMKHIKDYLDDCQGTTRKAVHYQVNLTN
ncbi:GNAT family N-acetyltransferase [Thalassomonas sp. M1454]|uniref:GNAT family N-acetyltransferase n=1 Tax=Thalassomonas sp. M1454 TaxID=2594477 RepID=UPI00117E7040|nr:GNAT family N-acetyltransferase [Thalassomonas sp. M1454]TRX55666.1 GNAT family N-acetyltransferase [Thalassomonas sp. M1454]